MNKVSICMPNYNYGHFIEQAVLSAFNQNYTDLELIVVDDGSTDNSLEKLAKLEINAPIPMKILNGNQYPETLPTSLINYNHGNI